MELKTAKKTERTQEQFNKACDEVEGPVFAKDKNRVFPAGLNVALHEAIRSCMNKNTEIVQDGNASALEETAK